jgi:predicted amidohydrolase
VPIQFFKDGLPAASQEVWNSPWGKIAIPVCYDLSYRHVMDRFIAKGAQAIIVPFMDVTDWGAWQHRLPCADCAASRPRIWNSDFPIGQLRYFPNR